MIYVCIPSHDEAATVGLLLWKIRKVLGPTSREYQLLVADDGSADATAEVLEPYTKVLPLTVIRHERQEGYARTVEELLRLALERSDRPKRDCAVLMHADFAHGPQFLPELLKRIDSGADVVVAQGRELAGEPSRGERMVRRWAPLLLRRRVVIPGVADVVSGFAALRLITLRNAFRARQGPLLTADGWAANAELLGRTAAVARRVEAIDVVERHDLRQRPSRFTPWQRARGLWRAAGALEIPAPVPPAPRPAAAEGAVAS